jgi:cytoskeletal protein RodZ
MEEVFDQIGIRLKSAREAAGLVVDDVVFRTGLPKNIVIALENEDFYTFTSPLYAKSFLAQYSDFLKVDALPWIDAIEPGSFVPSAMIGQVVEAPETVAVLIQPASPQHRAGWFAVLGLLAVSVALVYGAVQGYDAFESRFGKEPRALADPIPGTPEPTLAPVSKENPFGPPVASKSPVRKISASEKEDSDLAQPPPRAIIVR